MQEDFNVNQIIRKDARGCFVESLNDAFEIGKIHLTFASYDTTRPAGQRQTNNVHIYISVDEFLELCRKLSCGELQYMMKSRKENKDSTPLFQHLGGTCADKLKKLGRERKDGKSSPERCSCSAAADPISSWSLTVARERPMPPVSSSRSLERTRRTMWRSACRLTL